MNAAGIALAWLAIQVTLLGLFATGVYAIARRLRPAAAPLVVLSSLVSVVVLSLLALSGWPRWSFLTSSSGTFAKMHAVATSEIPPEPTEPSSVPPRDDARADAAIDHSSRRPALVESVGVERLLPIWRTFLHELSRRPALQEPSTRRWPMLISFAFAVAAGAALIWLTAGLMAVRGYRRRSRPIEDADVADQIDRLRAELDCHRTIEIRQTDELVTAATIGWRRPVLLLPPVWREWTEPQRRAVLAHEIAHIRSGDFLSILLGQIGLLLHFYHPLMHWLMGRLRLEQELAADAAAAAVSGGRRAYLTAIAELALAQPHRPMGWPARSFLPTRTTFLRRIAMLRDSKLRHERLSRPARALAVGMVVLFGLFIAGLRGPVANRSALADQVGPAGAKETAVANPLPRAATKETAVATDGIDLTYVPHDTKLLITIRPTAILSRPELAPLLNALEVTWGFGIPMEDLRQITIAVQLLPSRGVDTLVLQTNQPHDFEPFIRRFVHNAKPVQYKGKTFDASPNRGAHVLYRPDDRTALVAPESTVKAIIDGNAGRLPRFLDAETWGEFQDDQLLFAVDSAGIQGLEGGPRGPSSPAVLGPISPLFESTSALILGVNVDDRIEAHGAAFSNDRKAAKRTKETLEALAVLGRNLGEDLQDAFLNDPQGPRETGEAKLALLMLGTADRLLENLQIERQKKIVRLTTSVDMSTLELGALAEATRLARTAALRSQSTNNLKQIALGMHNFHDMYKRFPPAAAGTSKTQEPMKDYPPHSWRVALLPFVEGAHLYDQYHFDEPWDSPANRKLLDQMPSVYRHPKDPPGTTDTCYFALTGPGTVFSNDEGISFAKIRDGTSNTLLIVEAKRSVPWTKPEDIPYDAEKPMPELGGYFDGGFHAARCDGSVAFFAHSVDEKVLRALISIAGDEVIRSSIY